MSSQVEHEKFCKRRYRRLFTIEFMRSNISGDEKRRRFAQKKAIKLAAIQSMKKFPHAEPAEIWKSIYIAHVHNVSGENDLQKVQRIISAENSWKKSSGHAFEEIICTLGNLSLEKKGIKIFLQKELNHMIKEKAVANEVRDVSWLKEQIASSVFDMYMTVEQEDKIYVFSCVQSKTSIRDRVTRDREPSINAMNAFFWSIAIALDGKFLRLPKFRNMVQGNSREYKVNGWHGMYVFSNEDFEGDRIFNIDIEMETLAEHAEKASQYWLTQRQWFNNKWHPEIKPRK